MIQSILFIRWKQMVRIASEMGLVRLLFLLGLLYFGIYTLCNGITSEPHYAYGFIGAWCALLALIQLKRSDLLFLRSQFEHHRLILYAEYAVLSMPILCWYLVEARWEPLVMGLLLYAIIPHLSFSKQHKTRNTYIQRLIPSDCFEWKAGVRKRLNGLSLLWILGMLLSFHTASVPIALFAIGILVLEFNDQNEALEMVLVFEKSSQLFILGKIKRQIALFFCLVLPLVLVFLLFHFQYWYVPLAEVMLFAVLLSLAICVKYAHYSPNQHSPAAKTIMGISTVGTFLLVLIPFTLIAIVIYYHKSTQRLKPYLNDFH